MKIGNRPAQLKKDLTQKNIFGKEKVIYRKGIFLDLEEINVVVSIRGEKYTVPIENIDIPRDIKDRILNEIL